MDNPSQTNQERLWAGKSANPEALEKGYNEQARETQRIIAERTSLNERIRLLQATNEQLRVTGLSNLEDTGDPQAGMDVDNQRTFIAEELQRILHPLLTSAEAVGYFGEDQAKISTYLRDNPEAQATFQRMASVDPQGAADLISRRYRDYEAATVEAHASTTDTATRRERAETRPAAEVPAGRGVSRSTPDNTNQHAERLESLAKAAREGDWNAKNAYARERLFGPEGKIEMWAPGEPPPASMLKGNN